MKKCFTSKNLDMEQNTYEWIKSIRYDNFMQKLLRLKKIILNYQKISESHDVLITRW